jgi:hypothetical protein
MTEQEKKIIGTEIKGESADLEPPAPQHFFSTSAPFQHLSTFSAPRHLFSTSTPFQHLSTFSAPQHLFSSSAPFQHFSLFFGAWCLHLPPC